MHTHIHTERERQRETGMNTHTHTQVWRPGNRKNSSSGTTTSMNICGRQTLEIFKIRKGFLLQGCKDNIADFPIGGIIYRVFSTSSAKKAFLVLVSKKNNL